MIAPADITGVVLAGGRGSRMGGVDKGLQDFRGAPLVQHALQRLRPQVGAVTINANRHLETYAAFGVPVVADALPDHPGPLAGFLAGLEHCGTPWLMTVPCDAPLFPLDLVQRLAGQADQSQAPIAIASAMDEGSMRPQPVFCLMRRTAKSNLARFVAEGGRTVMHWLASQGTIEVPFDGPQDAGAFANANTLADLERMARV